MSILLWRVANSLTGVNEPNSFIDAFFGDKILISISLSPNVLFVIITLKRLPIASLPCLINVVPDCRKINVSVSVLFENIYPRMVMSMTHTARYAFTLAVKTFAVPFFTASQEVYLMSPFGLLIFFITILQASMQAVQFTHSS